MAAGEEVDLRGMSVAVVDAIIEAAGLEAKRHSANYRPFADKQVWVQLMVPFQWTCNRS